MASQAGVEVSMEEVRVLLEAGRIYVDRKEYDKAREVFEGARELAPDGEAVLICLANLDLVTGKGADAVKSLKEALKANPKSALAKALLGEAYHTQGKKGDAEKELKEAKKLDPNGPGGKLADALLKVMALGLDYTYGGKKK